MVPRYCTGGAIKQSMTGPQLNEKSLALFAPYRRFFRSIQNAYIAISSFLQDDKFL